MCRYITEGCFRASHRNKQKLDSKDPRWKAVIEELPQHSFKQADRKDLQPGVFSECHFSMLPTSFCFSQVRP